MNGRALERARVIDSILDTRTSWGGGGGVGVFGADVCALCGQIDTYRGRIMAAYGCHFGPQNEFVCSECRDRLIPNGTTGLSERQRPVRKALEESRVRYCRLCEVPVGRDPRWGRETSGRLARLCVGCRSELEGRGVTNEDEIVDVVGLRVRKRYLELLSDEELEGVAWDVDGMREELDSMNEEAKKPGGK
jgi:hypothetical protein